MEASDDMAVLRSYAERGKRPTVSQASQRKFKKLSEERTSMVMTILKQHLIGSEGNDDERTLASSLAPLLARLADILRGG